MRNISLSELTYGDIKESKVDLVILPWGATEAHNYHLPYSTDTIETGYIANESARRASDRGANILVLPTIPYGVNTGQADIRFCMNLMPSTQASIINDLLNTLYSQGIRKMLILNGHGGNDFKPVLREAGSKFPGMIMVTANWFEAVDKKTLFEKQGDHADEMETSIMMYIAPDLVKSLDAAGNGESKKFRVRALNEKWAWSERKWSEVTGDTGIGNPKLATSSKGSRYLEAVIGKVADLINDLAGTDPGDFYSA